MKPTWCFRQDETRGDAYRHWFRGKYVQQCRIFFRFSQKDHIIILAWVNDEGSKRAYESKTDAYRAFRKILEKGNPADDWTALLEEARKAGDDASFDQTDVEDRQ
jgi:toxin YhaV